MINKVYCILFFISLLSCAPRYDKNAPLDCATKQPVAEGVYQSLGLSPELTKNKTGVYSLEDGGESLVLRAWLCDQAKKTLDVQYYIFTRDNTGLIACDFLVRAANRGVKIRLIIDDATVKAGSHEIHALDSHENIEIKIYNPGIKLGKLSIRLKKIFTEFGKLHRRMHIKTITVDDQASITGGRNIADEYFDYDKHYNFRDRDVLIIGQEVAAVKKSFEEYWNDPLCVSYEKLVRQFKNKKHDPHRFDRLHQYACDTQNFSPRMREKIKNFPEQFKKIKQSGALIWLESAPFIADPPGKNEDRKDRKGGITTDSLIGLVNAAKKSIDIQSPYLILTDQGKNLFREAVKRGVKVRVLTNSLSSTDNFEAFSGYQRDRENILKTGIEVYEFRPDAPVRYKVMSAEVQSAMSYTPVFGIHSKTMLVDGEITVIGSFNLDPRSANLNTECIVIMRSKPMTKIVSKYVEEEFLPENAWHITPEFNPDSFAKKNKRAKALSRNVVPKKIL